LPDLPNVVTLDERLNAVFGTINKQQPYAAPSEHEKEVFWTALQQVLHGTDTHAAETSLTALGYSVQSGEDEVTGRPYTLLSSLDGSSHFWGAILIDMSQPARYTIGVPHPKSDIRTEQIGVDVWRKATGTILVVAGTHRYGGINPSDPAHDTTTLFHYVITNAMEQGVGHVQLHGFSDANLPGTDVVISSGVTEPSLQIRQIATTLTKQGLRIGNNWSSGTGRLLGRLNVQGQAARQHGAVFIHVEMSASVRSTPSKLQAVLTALTGGIAIK
jgi:hypothetical protein